MQSPFKDLPREVSVLVAASFFVAVGFGIVLPAIPVFARTFGVNSLARYMAIWRGRAMLAGRFLEYMSATLIL
jgi:hypothetical protein